MSAPQALGPPGWQPTGPFEDAVTQTVNGRQRAEQSIIFPPAPQTSSDCVFDHPRAVQLDDVEPQTAPPGNGPDRSAFR